MRPPPPHEDDPPPRLLDSPDDDDDDDRNFPLNVGGISPGSGRHPAVVGGVWRAAAEADVEWPARGDGGVPAWGEDDEDGPAIPDPAAELDVDDGGTVIRPAEVVFNDDDDGENME